MWAARETDITQPQYAVAREGAPRSRGVLGMGTIILLSEMARTPHRAFLFGVDLVRSFAVKILPTLSHATISSILVSGTREPCRGTRW